MSRKTREDGRKKRTCCIVIIKCLLTIKYKHTQLHPRPPSNFQALQPNFVTFATANLAALQLTATDPASITAAHTRWAAAFPPHSISHASLVQTPHDM